MNGRLAKRLRRENKRPRKSPPNIEWPETADYSFDKKLYWERRNKGLPGQIKPVVTFQVVAGEKGNKVAIPVSGKYPPKSNRPMYSFLQQTPVRTARAADPISPSLNTAARSNARGE